MGGGVELEGVFLLAVNLFFSTSYIFSFASNGILRKTVLVPPLSCMNFTTVHKDFCCLALTVCGGL